jgi:hypothetical protein
MKLIGLVFLGLVSGFAITYGGAFLIAWLLSLIPNGNVTAGAGGGGGEAGLLTGFLVVFPIAFFIGGIVTGYFSYNDIEDKWSLLFMAPALYVNLIWICVASVVFLLDRFIDVNPPGPYFLQTLLITIGMGLLWYVASAGGVFLGYFLRERFAKWWYGK